MIYFFAHYIQVMSERLSWRFSAHSSVRRVDKHFKWWCNYWVIIMYSIRVFFSYNKMILYYKRKSINWSRENLNKKKLIILFPVKSNFFPIESFFPNKIVKVLNIYLLINANRQGQFAPFFFLFLAFKINGKWNWKQLPLQTNTILLLIVWTKCIFILRLIINLKKILSLYIYKYVIITLYVNYTA